MGNIDIYVPQKENKLKGSTKISLDNGREVRVYESDNTFCTNNISKYLNSLGYLRRSFEERVTNIYDLFGGIFLFDKTIPANSEYMPAGTKMVGNATYDVLGSGIPQEMGSWVGSTITPTSIKLNYSWSSDQGNGIINSVCLTSVTGGYIGYGNQSGDVATTLKGMIPAPSTDYQTCPAGYTYDDHMYFFELVDSNTARVTINPSFIDSMDIFTDPVVKEFTLDYPISSNGTPYYRNGKIYILQGVTSFRWAAGAELENPLTIYDIPNDTVIQYKIVNNTGSDIVFTHTDNNRMFGITPDDKIVLGKTNDGLFYVVDYVNNVIENTTNPRKSFTSELDVVGWYGLQTTYNFKIYDYINDTLYPTNGILHVLSFYNENTDSFDVTNTGSHYPKQDGGYTNPLYLATINNLPEQITKTDNDIMNIEYTLSKS